MAKRIVEESSLVSVANAIRTKGGTTGSLVFPDGFVTAIGNIQSGGGGGGTNLAPLVDGSITEVTSDMMEGCTNIRTYAFYNCKSLTSIVIPNGVTSIGDSAFYNCKSLTSIVIPNGVTSFANYAFYSCSKLTSIVIPNSVTSIGGNAFTMCLGLTSVVISDSVTSINNSTFSSCSSLTTVEMKRTTPPKLSSSAFKNCTALTQIIVPAGTLSAYQSATNWSAYADIMVETSA